MNREMLISLAQAYASYLFRDPSLPSGIQGIYLFGSVARGDFGKKSDVDIFIDVEKENEKSLEHAAQRALKRFLSSEECKKFALLGVKNEIRALVGQLKEWELKESVEKEGLVLFSQSVSTHLKKYFLVRISPIKNIATRNRVMRKIAGRKERHYQEKGLIAEKGGEMVDPKVFLIPAENINPFLMLFSREKAQYKLTEIWK